MPTREVLPQFWRDWARLTPEQREAFLLAVARFVGDLRAGGALRAGLGVKSVRTAPGIFELTWAPDGRATFSYGEPVVEGQPHVIWRRIGTHDVLRKP
jgi:hypothetical protein